ncbi:MAG: APC family permease [Gemmatimonadota bacterium]
MSTELKRSLRVFDGLAMIVGIMIGSGIFRTPGLVARELGRPWLTFVAWLLGGVLALLGSLVVAELATRYPRAGGKYVYAREAFGARAGFVVGWVEGLAIYTAAIAAIGVAGAEFIARIAGWPPESVRWVAVALVGGFTGINLLGVSSGRWAQNVITAAKVLALTAVVVIAFTAGTGAGWHGALPGAPTGGALFAALALAAPSVIWSYYGAVDAAKIAEEVVDPTRTLPRIFLIGIAIVTALYLLLNAAFLHVLPFEQIAASNLVAGDVAAAVFGSSGGVIIAVLALLVVLASLNGNVFVTPRVIFGLARDGLGPAVLTRVNAGATPWTAMVLIGVVSMALAASGTFTQLLALAVALILMIDGLTAASLFVLRARQPDAPFRVPLYPLVPALFILVYLALLVGTALATARIVAIGIAVLGATWLVSLSDVTVTRTTKGL